MTTQQIFLKYRSPILFILITLAFMGVYHGSQHNYFYSDDFHWLGRAVIAQDSPGEMFRIEGRDFNPVFLFLLWLIIKIFGLSVEAMRYVGIFAFAGVVWLFYYILNRRFNVQWLIALSAALLFGLNVFVSEVVLNLSATVYSLALLFFLAAVAFYLRRQKILFILFLVLAFLTKETIILAVIPLLYFKVDKRQRYLLAAVSGGLILIRIILQTGAATGSYTGFVSLENSPLKLFFILARSMNLSPYAVHWFVGILAVLLVAAAAVYFNIETRKRAYGFFLLMFTGYAVFFALLPKLSSRYFLFPSVGFWGIAALIAHYLYKSYLYPRKKVLMYVFVPLLLLSCVFNIPQIREEIKDFRILGDFCRQYIEVKAGEIKRQVEQKSGNIQAGNPIPLCLDKETTQPLADVYREIMARQNLPKLLPFRARSIGGVIEPRFLVPLIYYPGKNARWKTSDETVYVFTGEIYIY